MASPRPCAHAETPPPAPLPGLASPAMEKLKAALAGDGAPRRPETELRACHRQLAAAAPPSSSTDRAQVNPEEELEGAKREYLQAAVGVSAPERLAIPKLLHWYLLDFAKDVDSLMDCVCLQLPTELRQSAMRAVDEGRRRGALAGVDARRIQVLPYEFRFRMNAAISGGRMVARLHGGAVHYRRAASAVPSATPATPQHISHYLAHNPRVTWEALTASFPSAAPPDGHVDAVLLSLARSPTSASSPETIAKNAHSFFHWSAANSSSSSPHSLRSYCLLVHLLSRAALIRHASVILQSAIARHSSSPASHFLDAFFAAYEDSGTAGTTRGLHLLVHAYAELRLPEEALEACRYLARRGVTPSLSAFNAVLHAAQRSGRFRVAWEVFELMTLKRVYANQATVELVIGVLSREGALARTAALVERIHGKKCAPGVVAHVALALWIFEEARTDQGILLLRRMLQKNMVFDDISYSLMVHAHCCTGDLKLANEQWDDMVRRGCHPNAFVYTCLIGAHCRQGSVSEAIQLLQEMLSKKLKPYDATYSHLITGCFRQERAEEGSEYFDRMLHEGLVLDISTCNEIIESLGGAGEVGKANELATAMIDRGITPDQDTYYRLIDGYGKVGDAQGILKVYYEMEHKGLTHCAEVFTYLIRGLCQCGNPKEAEKLLYVMERKLLVPTSDIHDTLISSYCEKGNTKMALRLYDRMVKRKEKLTPSADTFMMLVRKVIKVKTSCSSNT